MTTTIQKWGNSQGIRLPKSILEAVKFSENEEIVITAVDNKIVIEKAEPDNEVDIEELFANYHGDYKPEEIDWGEPQGREVW